MLKKSIILALLIGWLAAPSLWARVWTDRQGRQTDAQFIRLKGDNVVLQKGMKPLLIPLKEFCDEDQEYIKELTKGKGGTKSASDSKSEDAPKDAAPPSAFKPKSEKAAVNEKSAVKEKSAADDDPFLTDEENAAKPKPTTKPKPTIQRKSETPAAKSKSESESDPFLSDDEKSTPDEGKDKEKEGANKTPLKPKGEKPEVPQINTDGGFDERTWTDVKGNKLTANFSHLDGKIVILLKDGVEQRVALDQFSYNDKLYIRQAMVELQKYQKFAGNHNPPPQQGNGPTQGAPPQMAGSPAMQHGMGPGAGFSHSPSPFDALNQMRAQQQADKARRDQEALAQQQELARQAEIARQQREEAERQRREQQEQQAEIQRQNAEQQRIAQQQAWQNRQAQQNPPQAFPTPFPGAAPQGQPQMVEGKMCMACKKPVPDNSKAGDCCPHCGVVWDVEEDAQGKVVAYSPWSYTKSIITLVAIGIGVIVSLVRKFSR